MDKSTKPVNIYTDGACSGNQSEVNLGGWGAILEYGQHSKEIYGFASNTTNNRMEMMALIESLEILKKEGQRIRVFSDSAYLMNCLREKWYLRWQRSGWLTSAKKPVENQALWEKLIAMLPLHDFEFYRVKGHINTQSKSVNLDAAYKKFLSNNQGGTSDFSYTDFIYITEMNNRADTLANVGIETLRARQAL